MDDRSLTEFEKDVIDAQLAVQLRVQLRRDCSVQEISFRAVGAQNIVAQNISVRDSSLRDGIGTHATIICAGRPWAMRPRRPGLRTIGGAPVAWARPDGARLDVCLLQPPNSPARLPGTLPGRVCGPGR